METILLLTLNALLVCSSGAADNSRCLSGPPGCAINKFFYNPEMNQCRPVTNQVGTCGALMIPPLSENVFDSLDECRTTCIMNAAATTASTQPPTTKAPAVDIPDLCYLPVIERVSGHTSRLFYYYDSSLRKCDWFLYFGQDNEGNENRFRMKQDCINTCVNPKPPSPSPSLLPSIYSSTTLTTPTNTLTTPTNTPTSPAITDQAPDRLTQSSAPPTRPRPSSSAAPVKVVPKHRLHPLMLVAIVFAVMVTVFGGAALMLVGVLWIVKSRRPLLIRDAAIKQQIPATLKEQLPTTTQVPYSMKNDLLQTKTIPQSHNVINHDAHTLTVSSV